MPGGLCTALGFASLSSLSLSVRYDWCDTQDKWPLGNLDGGGGTAILDLAFFFFSMDIRFIYLRIDLIFYGLHLIATKGWVEPWIARMGVSHQPLWPQAKDPRKSAKCLLVKHLWLAVNLFFLTVNYMTWMSEKWEEVGGGLNMYEIWGTRGSCKMSTTDRPAAGTNSKLGPEPQLSIDLANYISRMTTLIKVSKIYIGCRSRGNVLSSRSEVCGFKPGWGRWIFFQDVIILTTPGISSLRFQAR